jgi:hypothetical protein
MVELYGDPVAVGRERADHVSGIEMESSHHMTEEASEQVAAALTNSLNMPFQPESTSS